MPTNRKDPHRLENEDLGSDFVRLRFSPETGEAAADERADVQLKHARQRQERRERDEARSAAQEAYRRHSDAKRKAWREHGRVLSDLQASEVLRQDLDRDGTRDESVGGKAVAHVARKHLPVHLM